MPAAETVNASASVISCCTPRRAAGAEGSAHRELLAAFAGPRKKKLWKIAACRQQNESHQTGQRPKRVTHLTGEALSQRDQPRPVCIYFLEAGWIYPGYFCFDISSAARKGNSQTPYYTEKKAPCSETRSKSNAEAIQSAVRSGSRIAAERPPCSPNRSPVYAHLRSDQAGVTTERLLPQAVSDNRDGTAISWGVLFWTEVPAPYWLCPE